MSSRQDQLIRLLALYRPALLKVANQQLDSDVRQKEGASDLVQRTLEEASRTIDAFKGKTPGELKKWLVTILKHNISDARSYYRADKRSVSRERSLTADNVRALLEEVAAREQRHRDESRSATDDLRRLRASLEQLKPAERKLIEWRFTKKMTFEAIAKKLGKKEDAARMAVGRVLKKLRRMLDPNVDDPSAKP